MSMNVSQRVGHLDNRLRSKGCLSCIRMKVKCDETRPHCRRCLDARRECPGYRAPTTTFIVETGSSRLFTSSALPPSATLATDWTQNAVSHYVHHFVIDPDDGIPGMHDKVPQLYIQYPNKAYLQSAVQAVALANLAQVNRMSPAYLLRAQSLYGDAIQHLRVALNDDAEGGSATALITTELLSQYELIVGNSRSPMTSPHRQGMLQILRQRLNHGSEESIHVTQGAFINFLLENIGQTSKTPINPPPFALYPGSSSTESVPCKLLGIIHQVVSLCPTIPSALESQEDEVKLATQLRRFNEDLLNWETTLPEGWRYTIHSKPAENVQELEFPQATLVFPGINSMLLWNFFCMTRLDVLRCLDKLHLTTAEKSAIRSDMSLLVDRICSAIPQMTGQMTEVGEAGSQATAKILASLFATRSLFVAGQLPDLPAYKRLWILRQLEFIGQQKGIRQAWVLREQLRTSDS